jgi:hypothetical protein
MHGSLPQLLLAALLGSLLWRLKEKEIYIWPLLSIACLGRAYAVINSYY